MQNALWRMPARLLRLETSEVGSTRVAHRTEVAHGPLAELVQIASAADEDERMLLSIDCLGAPKRLVWADIRALRREPNFPVDI